MALRYAKYSDYIALYPAGLSEDDYEQYAPSAEAYIDVITHNRAEYATGYKRDRVTQAVCAIANEMHAVDSAKGESGARLTSVSNDGYTESYAGTAAASADAEGAAIRQIAMRWLSGTGLVSAL